MFHAFVINLDRHVGRMRFMQTQLEALGVPFSRFRAVNGYDPAEIAKADVASFANLSNGEIGVWESHRALWTTIAQGDSPACILEDDVVLASDFGRLDFPDDMMSAADVVKLDYFRQPSTYGTKRVEVGENRHAQRLVASERLASAYIVTPAGARRLLDGSQRYFEPVDELMFQQHSKLFWNLEIWKIVPAVAAQMRFVMPDETLPQDIEDGIQSRVHKTKRDPRPKLGFVKRNQMRLRRLADLDTTALRKQRMRQRLEAFQKTEDTITQHPEFFTPDRAHIEQGLAEMG